MRSSEQATKPRAVMDIMQHYHDPMNKPLPQSPSSNISMYKRANVWDSIVRPTVLDFMGGVYVMID